MKWLCECQSDCNTKIEMSPEEYQWITLIGSKDVYIIASDCPHGPEPTDILVEDRGTYKLYKETKR